MNYGGPIMFENDDLAKRWFESQMKQTRDVDHIDPKYWDLYLIGQIDVHTGLITGTKSYQPELIMEGESIR